MASPLEMRIISNYSFEKKLNKSNQIAQNSQRHLILHSLLTHHFLATKPYGSYSPELSNTKGHIGPSISSLLKQQHLHQHLTNSSSQLHILLLKSTLTSPPTFPTYVYISHLRSAVRAFVNYTQDDTLITLVDFAKVSPLFSIEQISLETQPSAAFIHQHYSTFMEKPLLMIFAPLHGNTFLQTILPHPSRLHLKIVMTFYNQLSKPRIKSSKIPTFQTSLLHPLAVT